MEKTREAEEARAKGREQSRGGSYKARVPANYREIRFPSTNASNSGFDLGRGGGECSDNA